MVAIAIHCAIQQWRLYEMLCSLVLIAVIFTVTGHAHADDCITEALGECGVKMAKNDKTALSIKDPDKLHKARCCSGN